MEKAGKERHAGIPEAVFVVRVWTKLHLAKPSHLSPSPQEDVDAYMRDVANSSAEVVLKRFDEQRNKYKFLEANLKQKKQRWVVWCVLASLLCCDCLFAACAHRLKNQIPDIQKTLDMVLFIKNRQARLAYSISGCILCADASLHVQAGGGTHTTHFMLSEGVYATAEVPPTDSVLLWLGVGCVNSTVHFYQILSSISRQMLCWSIQLREQRSCCVRTCLRQRAH